MHSTAPQPVTGVQSVTLGPFRLTDLDRPELLSAVKQQHSSQNGEKSIIFLSLHVGGLNLRNDSVYTKALEKADFLVADGISVAFLAKIAGGKGLYRHPTTDVGWEIIALIADELARPAKIALIGGPEGLARRAADTMCQLMNTNDNVLEIVYTTHGYHASWEKVLHDINEAAPDMVVVGLGMPTEALWVEQHATQLAPTFILTCGGWFSHIVGDEKRAPAWMRRVGLEWVARLAQSPGRLWRRYASGLWSVARMIPTALRDRFQRHDSPSPT